MVGLGPDPPVPQRHPGPVRQGVAAGEQPQAAELRLLPPDPRQPFPRALRVPAAAEPAQDVSLPGDRVDEDQRRAGVEVHALRDLWRVLVEQPLEILTAVQAFFENQLLLVEWDLRRIEGRRLRRQLTRSRERDLGVGPVTRRGGRKMLTTSPDNPST